MRTAREQGRGDRPVLMERSPAAVWTCLLGAGLILVLPTAFSTTTSETPPRPPRLDRCVFRHRANVTCYWEAGDADEGLYTLRVLKVPWSNKTTLFSCTTSNTSCTTPTKSSVRFKFCISVTTQGRSQDAPPTGRCQSGMIEVKLPPVTLESVKPVAGRPRCLEGTWDEVLSEDFPVSDDEVKTGKLKSQIELTSQGQFDVQVENVSVSNHGFLACPTNLRSDTSYTVRLRHSYQDPHRSPWSPWSNACQGRTAEDAPSAAPPFWRRVDRTEKDASRLVSLLWKPLPHSLANGRVLFYSVTCRTESGRIPNERGSCGDLRNTSTSCSQRLPAGRCSCALTASTSAGTSPEARIWLPGASETETQLPMHVAATPLSDSSLDVRWTAPADRATSGFVVEWFAVGEKPGGALHWERLNSSCRALVITEGVKPEERYVVSVKALDDRGVVAQNETVIYTLQGKPSAGPAVKMETSGSTVTLSWDPVPVELLHGFIRSYAVSYSTGNKSATISLPADTRLYSLKNLSPGNYNICVQAVTDAGAGAGSNQNMHIASEDISILMLALPPLMLTALALVLIACMAKSTMIKQKLCGYVPDPSNSSLANWIPKISLEKRPVLAEKIGINYSELILCKDEPPLSSAEQDLSYQGVFDLQSYSTHCCFSPLPASGAQTPQSAINLERVQNSTRPRTTSSTDLSSYSGILFSQNLPTPLQSASYLRSDHWQHSAVSVDDAKLQPGGDSEPCVSLQGRAARFDSPLSQTDGLKTVSHLLRQHQSPASFCDFSSIFHSSVLLSHRAETTSPQNPFSQCLYSSVPSLQPNTFPRPDALSDTLTKLHPPVPDLTPPVFVDFSYCRLDCDP